MTGVVLTALIGSNLFWLVGYLEERRREARRDETNE
jgi:hypothetical protein